MQFFVITSNSLSHFVPVFAYLFNKYYGEDQQVCVLHYSESPPDETKLPSNFILYNLGEESPDRIWSSESLLNFISSDKVDDYFVLFLEDMIIKTKVDRIQINDIFEACRELEIDRFCLEMTLYSETDFIFTDKIINGKKVIKTSDDFDYKFSLFPAVWNKKFFLENAKKNVSVWDVERHGTLNTINKPTKTYGLEIISEPPLNIGNAFVSGRLNRHAILEHDIASMLENNFIHDDLRKEFMKIGICVCCGPNKKEEVETFINQYLLFRNNNYDIHFFCDGKHSDDNLYFSTNLPEICSNLTVKHTSPWFFCDYNTGEEGHHNLMRNFIERYYDKYEYIIFMDSDLFLTSLEWGDDFFSDIKSDEYDLIGEVVYPYLDHKLNAFSLPRIYTPLYAARSNKAYRFLSSFDRLCENDFYVNQIDFDKNIFIDTGSHLFNNILLSGGKVKNIPNLINNSKYLVHLKSNQERWKGCSRPINLEEEIIIESKKIGTHDKKTENFLNFPLEIELEITSRCNLRCVQCSQSWTPDENKRDLPDNILEAMKPALQSAKSISLHGIGEPLLANNFWDVVDSINSDADISFHSNMTIMNDYIANKLTDGKIKIIDMSLDAATEETYKKIRGASFDKVLTNIKKLISVKNEKKSLWPRLRMNMTLMRENIEELPEFVQLSSDLGVNCVHVWRMNDDWYPKEVSNKFFTFKYEEQTLNNHKKLFNDKVKEAKKLAFDIGVEFMFDSELYGEE